jgi:hypothetical protein
MDMDSAAASKANGFKTAVDTIVAPKEAFEAIRVTPTWGLALLATLLLVAVASFLMIPAFQHAMTAGWPEMIAQNPRLAELTPQQQQTQLNISLKILQFSWTFVVIGIPILLLLQSLVMTVFNALGRGSGSFKQYWAAACNIAVPTAGLGTAIAAVIILLRGVDSFTSMRSVQAAMPSLAMLAPSASVKLTALLATITPFSLWAAGLTIGAMTVIGRVPRLQAWLAAVIWLLLPALFAFATAR